MFDIALTCGSQGNSLLVVDPKTQQSPVANVCAPPGNAPRKIRNALIDR
jgi:hypothetical protein